MCGAAAAGDGAADGAAGCVAAAACRAGGAACPECTAARSAPPPEPHSGGGVLILNCYDRWIVHKCFRDVLAARDSELHHCGIPESETTTIWDSESSNNVDINDKQ